MASKSIHQKQCFRYVRDRGLQQHRDVVVVFGEIVDSICGQTEHVTATKMFTLFVDLKNCIRKRFCSPGWTEEELFALSKQIDNFRIVTSQILGKYQASTMRTSKWQAFSHLFAALRQVGSLECIYAGVFESSHKILKT